MPGYGGYEEAARVLSPEAYCFLLNLSSGDTTDRVEFQLLPDNIAESKSALYNEVPIIGRSLPLIGYSSSSSRMVSLSLRFVALNSGEGRYSPLWVEQQVRWLESKVYPIYEGSLAYPPPRLLLVMGRAFSLQCIMSSYNTTWHGPWTVETGEAQSFHASVDIQLQEFGQNLDKGYPFDHDDAIAGKNQVGSVETTSNPFVQIPANIG